MVLLCKVHHRAVHEGGVRVCIDRNQQVVFFTPRGRALFEVPPVGDRSMIGEAPESGATPGGGPRANPGGEPGSDPGREPGADPGPEPGGSLTPDSRRPTGLRPSHFEGASRWKRDGDIPWEVEARAWEALDSG